MQLNTIMQVVLCKSTCRMTVIKTLSFYEYETTVRVFPRKGRRIFSSDFMKEITVNLIPLEPALVWR